jgi:hypothetical protein
MNEELHSLIRASPPHAGCTSSLTAYPCGMCEKLLPMSRKCRSNLEFLANRAALVTVFLLRTNITRARATHFSDAMLMAAADAIAWRPWSR